MCLAPWLPLGWQAVLVAMGLHQDGMPLHPIGSDCVAAAWGHDAPSGRLQQADFEQALAVLAVACSSDGTAAAAAQCLFELLQWLWQGDRWQRLLAGSAPLAGGHCDGDDGDDGGPLFAEDSDSELDVAHAHDRGACSPTAAPAQATAPVVGSGAGAGADGSVAAAATGASPSYTAHGDGVDADVAVDVEASSAAQEEAARPQLHSLLSHQLSELSSTGGSTLPDDFDRQLSLAIDSPPAHARHLARPRGPMTSEHGKGGLTGLATDARSWSAFKDGQLPEQAAGRPGQGGGFAAVRADAMGPSRQAVDQHAKASAALNGGPGPGRHFMAADADDSLSVSPVHAAIFTRHALDHHRFLRAQGSNSSNSSSNSQGDACAALPVRARRETAPLGPLCLAGAHPAMSFPSGGGGGTPRLAQLQGRPGPGQVGGSRGAAKSEPGMGGWGAERLLPVLAPSARQAELREAPRLFPDLNQPASQQGSRPPPVVVEKPPLVLPALKGGGSSTAPQAGRKGSSAPTHNSGSLGSGQAPPKLPAVYKAGRSGMQPSSMLDAAGMAQEAMALFKKPSMYERDNFF